MSQRDLLSKHETIATYDGPKERPCFFRTSLCPDRCNHGGTIEIFTIVKYLNYEKPGKYGDAESAKYHVRVKDPVESTGVTPQVKEVFDGLHEGDYVLLSWNHDYVHTDGCSYPERPITKLEKISKEEADKML